MSILMTILGVAVYLLIGIGVAVTIGVVAGKPREGEKYAPVVAALLWIIIVPFFLIWGLAELLSRVIEDQTDRWSK